MLTPFRFAGTSLLAALLLVAGATQAQTAAPAFQWLKNTGGPYNTGLEQMKTDAAGNVYAAGSFNSTFRIGTVTLTPLANDLNEQDLFLAKYDANGKVLWAKKMGCTGSDYLFDMAVDQKGNVFIAGGSFGSEARFGELVLKTESTPFFLAKFDAAGKALWVQSFAPADHAKLAVDPAGDLLVTGSFNTDSLSFGKITLEHSGAGPNIVFVGKLSAAGSVLWATAIKGYQNEHTGSITCDSQGACYLTVDYDEGSSFDDFSEGPSNGGYLVTKFNSSGTMIWINNIVRSPGWVESTGLAVDAHGNVFVCGNYSGKGLAWDGGHFSNPEASTQNFFLACYGLLGDVSWVRNFGGAEEDNAICLAAAGTGVYLSCTQQFNNKTYSMILKVDNESKDAWTKDLGEPVDYLSVTAAGSVYAGINYRCPSFSIDGQAFTNSDSGNIYYDFVIGKLQ